MRRGLTLFAVLLTGCNLEPPPEDGSGDCIGAWVQTQYFVEAELSAPSTADFPFGGGQEHTTDLGGGAYEVNSYVDSQNRLGGTVRTHFRARVQKLGRSGKWRLESLEFSER